MTKLLSICIPTYNRAIDLDRQLAWLAQEIRGFESDCEVIISDNCSADETPIVISKWQSAFSQTAFKVNRNAENIGWMSNFIYCYRAAQGQYTWLIGDDDLIYSGTLSRVIGLLRDRSVALLYLNFSGRYKDTGKVLGDRWFDVFEPQDFSNGKAVFQRCLQKNIGSVIFITATICRTDFVRMALQKWSGIDNWAGAAFWFGYCALHGDVVVTPENYVECAIGVSYWQEDPRAWFRIRHRDIPELYLKLQSIGYPLKFCRDRILDLLREDFFSVHTVRNLKDYLRSFKHKPLWTLSIVASFFAVIFRSFVGFAPIEIDASADEADRQAVSASRSSV